MIDIPNFTLEDMHCTACFFKDKESGSYKVEVSVPGDDDIGSIILSSTYILREMGRQMIAISEKAEKLMPFVWKGDEYEAL